MSNLVPVLASSALPEQALDAHAAILGTSGSGKSYTARGLVERLLRARPDRRVCVVDPKGDWWGVRLKTDGVTPAYPFVIVGGPHADPGLRLPEQHASRAAKALGRMVATSRSQVVVDLSDLPAGEMRRFGAAFLGELYHANRDALHLVVDEADEFAPQRTDGESAALSLGAMERIFKRGRQRGVRGWVISQRPASIHKDVLSQAQTLVAMKLLLPHDRAAIRAWMADQPTPEGGTPPDELLRGLPSLPRGVGVAWCPGAGFLERVRFGAIETYDSMRTPQDGERGHDVTLPAIDTAAVSGALAEAMDSGEDADAKQLRAELRATRARIAELEARPPGDRDQLAQLQYDFARLHELSRAYANECRELNDALTLIEDAARVAREAAKAKSDKAEHQYDTSKSPATPTPATPSTPVPRAPDRGGNRAAPAEPGATHTPVARAGRGPNPNPAGGGNRAAPAAGPVPEPQMKVLRALHWWRSVGKEQPTRAMVAAVAGFAVSGGTFTRYLSALSSAGLLIYIPTGKLALTKVGQQAWSAPSMPRTQKALHEEVRRMLPAPQWRIVEVLLRAGGSEMSRTQVAELAGLEASGGTFTRYVSALSSAGVVWYPRKTTLAASSWLFLAEHDGGLVKGAA